MRKLTLPLIAACIGFSVQGQNLIRNGQDFSNPTSGVAESWFVGTNSDSSSTEGGVQYNYANSGVCGQAHIYQYVEVYNTYPKKYQVEFDLESNVECYVTMSYSDQAGVMMLAIPEGTVGMNHYSLIYDQNNISVWNIHSLRFWNKAGGENWVRIDNVTMTEITSVGFERCPELSEPPEGDMYTLQGEKLNYKPRNMYYIKNRKVYYGN